jgi:hypothetical protein
MKSFYTVSFTQKKTKGLLIDAMVWYSKILLTVDDVLSAVSFPAL